MKVSRFSEAVAYDAPNHFGCASLRLQGFDVSPTENFWVGLSHFLPGGGCEHEATPLEKVYVVLAGEVTVTTDTDVVTLGPNDSCYIAANEPRSVANRGNEVATMVVVMPNPPKAVA